MWTLRAAVCLLVASVTAATDTECGGCSGDVAVKPPGFLLENGAAEVWSEVTLPSGKTVVREVQVKDSDRSFLEYNNGTQTIKLLYDRKEKLLYRYYDYGCTTMDEKAAQNFYKNTFLFQFLNLKSIPEVGFLGPAAIFEQFATSADEARVCDKCNSSDPDGLDRGIPCVRYGECTSEPRSFWYTKKGYSTFEQGEPRPLRADIKSAQIDVMSIKIFEDRDSLPSLFVPTGLGCVNPKSAGKKFPFDGTKHAFEGEVVASVVNSANVFVYELSGLIIPSAHSDAGKQTSGIYSFTTNTFRNAENGLDVIPDHRINLIHDVDHGMVYEQIFRTDSNDDEVEMVSCFISDGSAVPTLEVPYYGKLDISSMFLKAPEGTFNYLGSNSLRFENTEVYEVTAKSVKTLNQIELKKLVTSFHFSQGTKVLKGIVLTGYGDQGVNFTVTIHVTKFDSEPKQLNEKLRIDHCVDYIDKSELRWFQIGFQTEQTALISMSEFNIREAFVNTLYKNYHVEPMRIPQVNVEFLDEQVNIKALLLERPSVLSAFKDPVKKDLRQPSKVLGVMSMSACQITCLGLKPNECSAVSYCGATCSITGKTWTNNDVVNTTDCDLYERKSDDHLIVSSVILRELDAAATNRIPENQFKLTFEVQTAKGPVSVNLIGDSFDVTKDYDNAFHFDKNKVPILESSFSLAAPKKRYTTSSLGSLELEDCALACVNRKECESFSFCDNSRECTVSKDHEVITANTANDLHCIIYQLKYLNRFEKLPGLTIQAVGTKSMATSPESCAQRCVNSESCLSFEFCDKDAEGDCVLLSTHVADAKAVTKTDKKCSHYSKKFLFDYTQMARRSGKDGKVLASFNNTSQEACAKMCSEWGSAETVCLSFDFCGAAADNTGLCTLRTIDGRNATVPSTTCDFFYISSPPKNILVRHGAGSSVGYSVLMILIGIGLGFGGLYGYNAFRGA